VLLLCGCVSTRYLLDENSDSTINLVIKADPYYQFKLREIVENALYPCGDKCLQKLRVKVEVTKVGEPAAFSEKEVIKEHKKLVAKIKIYDERSEIIAETSLDSFAMYDVSDEFPYSGIAGEKSATNDMLNDLGIGIANYIMKTRIAYKQPL
jgi:hypothetical protein